MHLTIVIPAYNEETNIRLGALDKVALYFEKARYQWDVIVVNDGSSDATKSLIGQFVRNHDRITLLDVPHRGKAAAVISGMLAATGDIVLFTDLDQATPIEEVEKLLPWFDKGYDVVFGSRAGERRGAPLFRRIMARGFMMIRTVILGLHGIKDTQCGFKAFRKSVSDALCKKLKLYSDLHMIDGSMVTAGFDIEVLYLTKLLGYRMKEVPVEWHYVDTRRVSPVKDSVQGLTDIIRIRVNALQGKYDRT